MLTIAFTFLFKLMSNENIPNLNYKIDVVLLKHKIISG